MKAEKKNSSRFSASGKEAERDDLFISRLRELADGAGSVNALSKAAGVSQSGLQRYLNGGEPSRKAVVAIAKAGGVSVEWLATGEGERDYGQAGEDADEFAYVEQIAGKRGVIRRRHAVRRDWLAAQGLDPSRLSVMETREDSMAPTVQPGDLLLCETYTHHPEGEIKMGLAPGELPPQDGIYLIRRGDKGPMSLRRLRLDMAGGVFIFADTDTSLYLHATCDIMADISILARVVSLQRLV